MQTEILRIIEGGLMNDRRKILSYSTKLADRLEREGNMALSKCIRQKLEDGVPHSAAIADVVRMVPLDQDSRLQIVEVIPSDSERHKVVLTPEVNRQIADFIDMVSHGSELELAGVNIKKTLLLHGCPGCGKTSIAHYISEQTGLPLVVARLDGIISSLLGNTAKNIRKIFDYANSVPCILFLDEFDAIAKARNDQHELGELKRVINSLLQNIDSMPADKVLIAATNHAEMLDDAIWRRFVQTVEVGLPGQDEIFEMIDIFSEPFTSDLTNDPNRKRAFAKCAEGLSPSDLKTVFDRAKVRCVLNGTKVIPIETLLHGVYTMIAEEKTEQDYVRFLSDYGMPQLTINKVTGIGLRKIKLYLSPTLMKED